MHAVELFETQDGSHSLLSQAYGVSYHSKYGAIQESVHVFIQAGLYPLLLSRKELAILEVGLGTGLNALLTLHETQQQGFRVSRYEAIEAHPISIDQATALNYPAQLSENSALAELFRYMHSCSWEEAVAITPLFTLVKRHAQLQDMAFAPSFDLVFYDAFAPSAQPELWTQETLSIVCAALKPGGVLVTYCAKGEVKRHFKALGLKVESLPGPPGKREMIRAVK
jgi:tRNA U34 5-methylaminomethyl-2-thiouridine-forming methyltransferase MnmC